MSPRAAAFAARFLDVEHELCRRATRWQEKRAALAFFRAVSRLGDGPAWLALAMLMPAWWGVAALPTVARFAVVGMVAAVLVRALKRWTVRPRPFASGRGICAGAAPLDPWSFPSGHTLHAVAFNVVAAGDLPALALALAPFTLAVAASRVVLGLHYPSDVAAGAGLGLLLAAAVLALP
jgi:undecaprenyl-diphosphatase